MKTLKRLIKRLKAAVLSGVSKKADMQIMFVRHKTLCSLLLSLSLFASLL
jgi:hypothetical protein